MTRPRGSRCAELSPPLCPLRAYSPKCSSGTRPRDRSAVGLEQPAGSDMHFCTQLSLPTFKSRHQLMHCLIFGKSGCRDCTKSMFGIVSWALRNFVYMFTFVKWSFNSSHKGAREMVRYNGHSFSTFSSFTGFAFPAFSALPERIVNPSSVCASFRLLPRTEASYGQRRCRMQLQPQPSGRHGR